MKNIPGMAITVLFSLFCSTAAAPQHAKTSLPAAGRDAPKKIAIAGDRATVPTSLYRRKPVVEVRINGKGPFTLFLDTGAGATVLDQTLADELKLPTRGITKIGDPSDPEAITATRNHVDSLEVGRATFSDLIAVSWDRSSLYAEGAPRGVLGMPLFATLLLTVDYPGNRIVLGRGSLARANGKDILDYHYSALGMFGIPLKVGQADVAATLDTGSPGGLLFPLEYRGKLSLDGKPSETGKTRSVGGVAIIYGAKLKDTVRLGRYVFENPNIAFLDRLIHVNIGYEFISQFAITIDQKNRRIKFEKPSSAAASKLER